MAPGVDPALLPCCVLEALGCGWPATSASKCQCTTSWHVTHIWDVWTCWGNGPKFVGEVPAASPVRQSDIGLLGACKSPRYRHVAMLPECLCRFWTPRVSTHADPATAFHACAARRVARFNHGTCRGRRPGTLAKSLVFIFIVMPKANYRTSGRPARGELSGRGCTGILNSSETRVCLFDEQISFYHFVMTSSV